MLDLTGEPVRQTLPDGLVMRSARDESDLQAVAELHSTVHGPGVGVLARDLFVRHPDTRPADLIFVEDEQGCIVSSLCLIPWDWRYSGVALPVGEQAIVATREDYRGRGLIRAQEDHFKRRLVARGCLLSHVEGIPYFYRQFGYEYALPLEGGLKLELGQVPEPFGEAPAFRLAGPDDVPVLQRLYDAAAQELAIHVARSRAVWRYLLETVAGSEAACETWLIERGGEGVVGYLRLPQHHFGEELAVNEVSLLDYASATAALAHLKSLAEARHTPGIRLNLPAGCTLMRLAQSLGARDLGTYAWQIYVPDVPALLRALIPVFEQRIGNSPFAGLTLDVSISFYREASLLSFEAGRLVDVKAAGQTDDCQLRCPPRAFVPLLLGHRSIDEQASAYPDLVVARRWRLLVDTLFPKVSGFLYSPY